jgi:hypothetical protein
MMEFQADRPKISKPLEQQTPEELFRRFTYMAGGWGNYSHVGMLNMRHHLANLAPGMPVEPTQIREWSFEGNILLLAGTGAIRSPQARFRKLPNQPLSSRALVGTWQRTALSVQGAPVQAPGPEHLILGEDGWFHQTLYPPGRTPVQGKPLEKWTTQEYVGAYRGMSASRGTYAIHGGTLIRKHIADTDPNLEGRDDVAQFTLQGDALTLQGTNVAGQKYEARFQRMKPFDIYAPPPPAASR